MTEPSPAADNADWLRKLVMACDQALDRLPEDQEATSLHADIASLRADLQARVDKFDAEDAA